MIAVINQPKPKPKSKMKFTLHFVMEYLQQVCQNIEMWKTASYSFI